MTACEVAWSRLPQAGMQVHRGLLYDQMNLQAVARHAIASQPRFSHLTPEVMVRRIWSEWEARGGPPAGRIALLTMPGISMAGSMRLDSSPT